MKAIIGLVVFLIYLVVSKVSKQYMCNDASDLCGCTYTNECVLTVEQVTLLTVTKTTSDRNFLLAGPNPENSRNIQQDSNGKTRQWHPLIDIRIFGQHLHVCLLRDQDDSSVRTPMCTCVPPSSTSLIRL